MNDRENKRLWDNISDDDFRNESNIEEDDVASYDMEKMRIFSANINYFRQIIRLSDSLKPVERRVLYSMYLSGAKPNTKSQKCNKVIGNAMTFYAHGDGALYASIVNMAQPWKKACPLIDGQGNFGNDAFPEFYAHSRYTEALMSKYAWECFFEDYDQECVEMIECTAADGYEPMSLPSKFPNILVNGGTGIAIGNSFCIPPYNITDIIAMTKKLIINPEHPNVFMIPDFPTGCQIVDDGESFKEICDTGTGTIRMRSKSNIIDNGRFWCIQITAIPWLTSLTSIHDKLSELTKKGTLPIKEIQNKSYPVYLPNGTVRTMIDYRILFDKNHDPYKIRDKIFSATELEKTISANFKVVLDNITIGKLSLRELILEWIDGRREYKRRLLNKKIVRLNSRITLLEILIYLLNADNIEKTIGIIKNSDSTEVVSRLRKFGNMSSYQATKIAEMKLSAFTKDSRARYIQELDKVKKELEYTMDLIKSEKKIDRIIIDELDDLKKYTIPRKSEVVSANTGKKISNTDHVLIFTKQDNIKKLAYNKMNPSKNPVFGSFKPGDYPTKRIIANNMDSIIIFDSLGKYTRIAVNELDSTEPSSPGINAYDSTKLNGHIITVSPDFNPETEAYVKKNLDTDIFLVTLSKMGSIKKTPISEFIDTKSSKNARAMKLKDDDEAIYAGIIMNTSTLIIYTKKGEYTLIPASEITTSSKNSMGVQGIKLEENDECAGLSVIGNKDDYILVITEKGCMKKCEIQSMNISKRGVSSYLANVEPNDSIIFADSMSDKNKVVICTRQSYFTYNSDEIATLTRRAKCQKKVPLPIGTNIIAISVD